MTSRSATVDPGREDVHVLRELVARFPNNAIYRGADVLHKRYISALVQASGVAAARSSYSLERLDSCPIELSPTAVVGCLVMRNEEDRVGAVLDHHRRLGVDRFFVIDNGSTDGTVRVLQDQADVHVWSSEMPFQAANFGAAWFEVVLREHARGHWLVMIDADELLWYPEWETQLLPEFCAELDASGHRAFGAALLDMYSRAPLAETRLSRDESPLEICGYFDRRWYHTITEASGPFENQIGLFGGVRRRVFGGRRWDYCLNKVPLLRYDLDTVLVGGQHATNLALAPTRGAVLHFKFDERLVDYARRELERGQREAHAGEYHAYVETLEMQPRLTFYDPAESIALKSSAQLVELGIMGPVPNLDDLGRQAEAFLRLAEARYSQGDRRRAIAYLRRAGDLLPTAITPLLRVAQLSRDIDDGASVAHALGEAAARDPGSLPLLELCERSDLPGPLSECESVPSGAQPRTPPRAGAPTGRLDLAAKDRGVGRGARWATALRALAPLHSPRGVLFDDCVDATFGWPDPLGYERQVHSVPWVGCVHSVPAPPKHLVPFVRHGLPALWETPELLRSMEHCLGLFTFTERGADWLRLHTAVPISVVPRPIDPPSSQFDFEQFARNSERQLVQLGWWMTRLNAICDLPIFDGNRLGLRKIRNLPAAHHRTAVGLARAEREHAGLQVSDPALATVHGTLSPADRAGVLATGVVFGHLYDANADPVVLECVGSATPMLVNRHPGVVEYLGLDYPLYFETVEEAAAKAVDIDAIASASRHLSTDEVRQRPTPDAFRAAVRDSAVYQELRR